MAQDDEDFRRMLEAEMPRLRRVAVRVAPLGVDADDLAHDALERAWRNRSSFRADAPFGAWLYRILLNRAADLAKKRMALPVDVATVADRDIIGVAVEDPATLLARAADGERMRVALARLGPVDRAVVVLHDGEGLPVPEIAVACGLRTAAAHKRLQRARAKLVQALLDPAGLAAAPETAYCVECCALAAAYLNSELDEARRPGVEAHLHVCDRCPPLAQAAVGLRAALDRGSPATGLHDQISAALRADHDR